MTKKVPFKISDKCRFNAFVDCFGAQQNAVEGMTITDIRLIKGESIPDYYRIAAETESGVYREAASKFFALEGSAA